MDSEEARTAHGPASKTVPFPFFLRSVPRVPPHDAFLIAQTRDLIKPQASHL